jgi:hypothetical protein
LISALAFPPRQALSESRRNRANAIRVAQRRKIVKFFETSSAEVAISNFSLPVEKPPLRFPHGQQNAALAKFPWKAPWHESTEE